MKTALVERIGIFLLREGYTVKNLNSCFDVLARKNSQILLIKALEDANSIGPKYTLEMKNISSYINAAPLIIAESAGHKLQDSVVYARFGVATINFNTFKDCIDKNFPFIKSTQAGLTAKLIGKKLKELRGKEDISLKNLARKIGVSSRMVVKYEDEDSEITVGKALKMYELFGPSVFDRIDVFETGRIEENRVFSDISHKYLELGFNVTETKKFFDVIAKRERELILTGVGDRIRPDFHSLSGLIDADNLIIFKKKKPKDIPSLTKKEFMEFGEADELIKFLREFE